MSCIKMWCIHIFDLNNHVLNYVHVGGSSSVVVQRSKMEVALEGSTGMTVYIYSCCMLMKILVRLS